MRVDLNGLHDRAGLRGVVYSINHRVLLCFSILVKYNDICIDHQNVLKRGRSEVAPMIIYGREMSLLRYKTKTS